MKKPLLPGYFAGIDPFASVFSKSEHETIAQNIMLILKRTGNVWRELSWDEYVIERKKDGNFTDSEKRYFDDVIVYCRTAKDAAKFSEQWNKSKK